MITTFFSDFNSFVKKSGKIQNQWDLSVLTRSKRPTAEIMAAFSHLVLEHSNPQLCANPVFVEVTGGKQLVVHLCLVLAFRQGVCSVHSALEMSLNHPLGAWGFLCPSSVFLWLRSMFGLSLLSLLEHLRHILNLSNVIPPAFFFMANDSFGYLRPLAHPH